MVCLKIFEVLTYIFKVVIRSPNGDIQQLEIQVQRPLRKFWSKDKKLGITCKEAILKL